LPWVIPACIGVAGVRRRWTVRRTIIGVRRVVLIGIGSGVAGVGRSGRIITVASVGLTIISAAVTVASARQVCTEREAGHAGA
jgi:hypothetical protein